MRELEGEQRLNGAFARAKTLAFLTCAKAKESLLFVLENTHAFQVLIYIFEGPAAAAAKNPMLIVEHSHHELHRCRR